MPDDFTDDCREHAKVRFGWIDNAARRAAIDSGTHLAGRACATCGAWTAAPLSNFASCAVIRCETHALAVCDHHWSC
jgi:hypothetical protein